MSVSETWSLVAGRPGDPAPAEGQLFLVHHDGGSLTPICNQANGGETFFRHIAPEDRTPDELCMRCLAALGDPRERVIITRVPSAAEVAARLTEVTPEQQAFIEARRARRPATRRRWSNE
jgi:hypothetical protein